MVKGPPAGWGICTRTVSLSSGANTLSHHNNSVAVGSGSEDIIILDAVAGNQIAVLSGHTAQVNCVTFSSDGKSLVSGSCDNTVKLWDVQTGGVAKTFHGHSGWVESVSISADCARIASGSRDKTACLWAIQTGDCLSTIKQQEWVEHVSFSPMDPQQLISISAKKVWWWDVNGHQIPPTYDGSCIAFSPDNTQFALCNSTAVTVRNSDSRAIVAEFHESDYLAESCCFSPDGRLIAAGASNIIYVWNISSQNPHLVETFVGHTSDINYLVFSSPSSLISVATDQSLKFWQIGALSTGQVGTDPGPTPNILPPIQSVSLQTRAGIAISSDKDGVVRTWGLSTGLCQETFQIPDAEGLWEGCGDAQIIDGRLIFVWYNGGGMHIWDTKKDKLLQSLDVPLSIGLRLSGDGSKILSLDQSPSIKAWSMWSWEFLGEVEVGLRGNSYLDSLYIESSRVRIRSPDSSVQEGWDFGHSSSSPVQFDPSTGRPHLDFIGGTGEQTQGPSWIKDTVTGKKVFQLSWRYAKPNDVQWDGQYLVAGYRSGEVLILDFDHMYPH